MFGNNPLLSQIRLKFLPRPISAVSKLKQFFATGSLFIRFNYVSASIIERGSQRPIFLISGISPRHGNVNHGCASV